MLILRIRQAQCALDDGRLDEAFELAKADDVRRHRRGQKLIGRVARALVQRGREHLDAGRVAQGLADSQKAARLGGNASEIAGLQSDVAQAVTDRQRAGRQRDKLLAAAREHVDNGRLTVGQRIVDEAADQITDPDGLQQELARRRDAVAAAAREVQAALDRDDWSAAIDKLLAARQAKLAGSSLSALGNHATKLLADRVRANIVEGRLDLAEVLLDRLNDLAGKNGRTQELAKLLTQCRRAAGLIQANHPHRAGRILRRLRSILPAAGWLAEAVSSCETAADALETLRSGALGLLGDDGEPSSASDEPEALDKAASRQQRPTRQPIGRPLPEKFLIQADGVGSFLVVRSAEVTIGPISSDQRPMVGLMAKPDLPVAKIARADDDYFLRCRQPVMVNDRPATERLLCHGDRIALSPRCRWRFLRPNAASTSAVLAFSGARLGQADTRQVILLDREIVMAPGPAAHIRADQTGQQAVLHVKNERLLCRSEMPVTVGGRPVGEADGIPLDVPVRIGPVSLVVTAA